MVVGSLITRVLILMFGYAYPAYECFKTVELNKPDIQQLLFWCQYWILVAMITVCERIGDAFVGWLPMYGEAKLAFFIYLWSPKTKGASYVYDAFFKPYVSKHETEIDRNLSELKTTAGDMVISYFQKAAGYGQTRIFEILQFIASQSTPSQPAQQPQQEANRLRKPATTSIRRSVSSPATTTPPSNQVGTEEATSVDNSKEATTAPTTSDEKNAATSLILANKASSSSDKGQVMKIDKVTSAAAEDPRVSAQDTIMEDAAVRVTRARSRKINGGSNN